MDLISQLLSLGNQARHRAAVMHTSFFSFHPHPASLRPYTSVLLPTALPLFQSYYPSLLEAHYHTSAPLIPLPSHPLLHRLPGIGLHPPPHSRHSPLGALSSEICGVSWGSDYENMELLPLLWDWVCTLSVVYVHKQINLHSTAQSLVLCVEAT